MFGKIIFGEIIFSTVNLIDKLSKLEDSYYKLGYELREFDNDRIQFKRRIREFDQGDTDRLGAQHQQL